MTTTRQPRVKPQPPTIPVGEITDRPIKPFLFGKDHWSTFGYIETRCVDHGGTINKPHMRTDWKRHPMLTGPASMSVDGSRSATRLFGGAEIKDHDDWDCVLDLEAAGLVTIDRRTVPDEALMTEPGKRGQMSGLVGRTFNPKVQMTALGAEVAGKLRAHKAGGGSFGNFVWTP